MRETVGPAQREIGFGNATRKRQNGNTENRSIVREESMNRRRANAAIAAGVLAWAGLASPPVFAQLNSSKTIRIIVPFAPAGSSDVLARVLQGPLQQELKQNVIVENRAGAGTNIGTAEVARAEPDGTTLLLTSSAFVVNPALYKTIPYDPFKDFAPIAALPVAPNIFATKAGGGINSLADVITSAKANPQQLNYASPGNGTTPQLTMELFKLKAGINITNIAYNGGGPATQALMTGTVDVLSTALPGAQSQVQAGTMKGIALTTTQRWPTLADVPTFSELGFPDITLVTEHFLLAPAGTPQPIVEQLTKATLAVLATDELKARVRQVGYEPVSGGPDMAKQWIARDVPFFKDLVKDAKIPQIE
jgi:tripartite-type tricarboxylate transporter receptor subunit TctC